MNAMIEKLEQLGGYVGEPKGNGVRTISCPLHEDRTPSAWIGDYAWGCYSCGIEKETLKKLAKRLGTTFTPTPLTEEEKERRKRRQYDDEVETRKKWMRYRDASQQIMAHSATKLDFYGEWYLTEFRSLHPRAAHRQGLRSFGPGLYPWDLAANRGVWPFSAFGIPPHFRRWGVLLIPYYAEPDHPPAYIRFRSMLIPSEGQHWDTIPKKLWLKPMRYWSPRKPPPVLFNEHRIHGADEIYVTEGELDAMGLEEDGCRAVAMGGQTKWERLEKLTKQHGTKRVVLVPDNEPKPIASWKAHAKVHLKHLRYTLVVPEHKDVDESRRERVG